MLLASKSGTSCSRALPKRRCFTVYALKGASGPAAPGEDDEGRHGNATAAGLVATGLVALSSAGPSPADASERRHHRRLAGWEEQHPEVFLKASKQAVKRKQAAKAKAAEAPAFAVNIPLPNLKDNAAVQTMSNAASAVSKAARQAHSTVKKAVADVPAPVSVSLRATPYVPSYKAASGGNSTFNLGIAVAAVGIMGFLVWKALDRSGRFRSGGRYIRDRSLGGKEIWIPDTPPSPSGRAVFTAEDFAEATSPGSTSEGSSSAAAAARASPSAASPGPASDIPEWWTEPRLRITSESFKAESKSRASRLVRQMEESKYNGLDYSMDDIRELVLACNEASVSVKPRTDSGRDAIFRFAADQAIEATFTGRTLLMGGLRAREFLPALAEAIGVPTPKAAGMALGAVAARTRGLLLSAVAHLRTGDEAMAFTDLSYLGMLWKELPLESGSPQLEMLGASLADALQGREGRDLYSLFTKGRRREAKGASRALNLAARRALIAQALVGEMQAADMEDILKEKDACGVGFIANLKNEASHKVVDQALRALGCMEHRGACSADDVSGDGSGVMTQIPWKLLQSAFPGAAQDKTGVGMIFLPNDDALEAQSMELIKKVVAAKGFKLVGFRDVPINLSVVGRLAKGTIPRFRQVAVEKEGLTGDALERELYLLRKTVESEARKAMGDKAADLYFCTLSSRTIVYKGMLNSYVMGDFYTDLKNPEFVSTFAIYHRRFSTNTVPKWPLAQPMRFLGHNGEINTLQGNLNWMASRQANLKHPYWAGHESELLPLCDAGKSDSANLDMTAELLVRTDVDPAETMMILVPEAFRNHPDLVREYPEVIPFYEYYEGLQEGWDGPALLVFSDGKKLGARLDRNGLRPARYWQTSDGMVYVASEVGVLNDVFDVAPNVIAKGRLGPGQMVYADLEKGVFQDNTQVAKSVATKKPYDQWIQGVRRLNEMGVTKVVGAPQLTADESLRAQASAGYGLEDAQMIVEGMAAEGIEPTYCMGDDTPLPVLSGKPHILADYFKQRFAQVTNPPIDPLREGLVMSLEMRLGKRGNLLQPGPNEVRQILLPTPILLESEYEAISKDEQLKSKVFQLQYDGGKPGAMKAAVAQLTKDVEAAVRAGCEIVCLTDRPESGKLPESILPQDATRPSIPSLLATGAVHHALIRAGLRTETSIVVETAQCFSVHHAAALIGYGAHAISPYLAFESCRQWRTSSRTEALVKTGKIPNVSIEGAQKNFKKAIEKGLLKIMSKMGISLLNCYHGAQIFECYGIGKDVIYMAFVGSVSRIGGLTLDDIQKENETFWIKGFAGEIKALENYGYIQSRVGLEYHANNQEMSKLLHKAIGLGGKTSNPEAYKAYMEHFEKAPVHTLRDCLDFKSDRKPIDIAEVEPAAKIMERFCTGGMSLGAISRETHETIAIAMNRIGGKSNSGEGGEDPIRWQTLADVDAQGKSTVLPHLKGLKNGDVATSKIKQVASGRFGVTPVYLANAEQVEIKIAQGAKPGEGGQLPGKKVSPYIAQLRRSKPGVPLISPPPHHDIYSIEDLAQLIYDLHQVNPMAKVSVKLVAQAGIGTVASGVAKANADIIQVSGHDGGTGASPVSSIKHAGGPVEMGLTEVHRMLTENELRERVVVRVDGGIRTGRDVLLTALMGADEFGFGTVAMIGTGCIMARVCHTNNCPVGVASQREELRARFPGAPEDLVNFFHYVAEEVRSGLAGLGYKSLDEVIGRSDILTQRSDLVLGKTTGLDLSYLTKKTAKTGDSHVRRAAAPHENGPQLDDQILADKDVQDAIKNEKTATKEYTIVNVDRSSLARVGGAVAKLHGDSGFAGQLNIKLRGSAGQSFAAFVVGGMNVHLEGEANDYVGKGMAGGEVVIVPPKNMKANAVDAALVGNTCLYGATGGRLFVYGRAGERFGVRNSMAHAVIEGAGDHCCEYMTGGVIVSLGPVGRNVAAGMTGGIGYFYDEDGTFTSKVNTEIVAVQRVPSGAGEAQLKSLIQHHFDRTGSTKAKALLADWANALPKFYQLVPPSEANAPECAAEKKEEATAAKA